MTDVRVRDFVEAVYDGVDDGFANLRTLPPVEQTFLPLSDSGALEAFVGASDESVATSARRWTCAVAIRREDRLMYVEPRLQPGDKVHCPHCRRWHAVVAMHREGTDYTKQMLFFACRGQQYYAGQIATVSRHETRPGSPEN